MGRKSKILLFLYILFSPFIDLNFKSVFTDNYKNNGRLIAWF